MKQSRSVPGDQRAPTETSGPLQGRQQDAEQIVCLPFGGGVKMCDFIVFYNQ